MDATANEVILVGLRSISIYRVFYPESGKIKFSRDVRVEDDIASECLEGQAKPYL